MSIVLFWYYDTEEIGESDPNTLEADSHNLVI